jgi:hypothetical protein
LNAMLNAFAPPLRGLGSLVHFQIEIGIRSIAPAISAAISSGALSVLIALHYPSCAAIISAARHARAATGT